MTTVCPFFTVPCQVGLQSVIVVFLCHTLFFFETIISVDDNTIVLHKIELKICSNLNKLKISDISNFSGLYNWLYFSARKRPWHVLFFFYIEH